MIISKKEKAHQRRVCTLLNIGNNNIAYDSDDNLFKLVLYIYNLG